MVGSLHLFVLVAIGLAGQTHHHLTQVRHPGENFDDLLQRRAAGLGKERREHESDGTLTRVIDQLSLEPIDVRGAQTMQC